MSTILSIALWIGIFALAGIAINLVLFTLVVLYNLPIDIYKNYKEKKRQEKMRAMRAEAVKELIKMAADHKLKMDGEANSDKAYKSAVKKATIKKKRAK